MPDVEKILKLVEQGVLTADEADQILAVLAAKEGRGAADEAPPAARTPADAARPRNLRIEVTENGRRVVNLRVPVNIAAIAGFADIVPGLPREHAERIRDAVRDGLRGTIVDFSDDDGDRVLIVNE